MRYGIHARYVTLALAISLATKAHAEVVVESYDDHRPADADAVLGPLRDELTKLSIPARPRSVIRYYGDALPLPGIADPAVTGRFLSEQVELAVKATRDGSFDAAINLFEDTLRLTRENPATVVRDATARTWLTKLRARLAFAYNRAGHPDLAEQTMIDQLAALPDEEITRAAFGGDVMAIRTTARDRLDQLTRGSVLVDISAPNTQLFIDLVGRARGGAFTDVVPGRRQLLVMSSTASRRYPLLVRAGQQTKLDIDWDIDSRFTASDVWVGIETPASLRQRREQLLSRIGERADGIIVVEISEHDGRRWVRGQATSRGRPPRAASVPVGDGDADDRRLRALAHYLANGQPSADIVLDGEPDPPAAARGSSLTGLLFFGGTALTIGGVITYLVVPGDDGTRPTYRDYRTPAVVVTVAGAALLGTGMYRWLRDRRAASPLTAALVSGGVSGVLAGTVLFATNEDTREQGFQRPTYRGTAAAGLVVGGAGVVAGALGVYSWHRHSERAIAPVVSISDAHLFVGVIGSL